MLGVDGCNRQSFACADVNANSGGRSWRNDQDKISASEGDWYLMRSNGLILCFPSLHRGKPSLLYCLWLE